MFWAAIWKSAGKPLNTTLHQIMKRSRNLYHFQVKKVLKAQNEIKKSKLLNCLVETNGDTDIFSEIKKLRRAPPSVTSVIDGHSSGIGNYFAGVYKNLYNSVGDQEKVMKVYHEVNDSIDVKDLDDVQKVTSSIVKEAIKCLNNNKTDSL